MPRRTSAPTTTASEEKASSILSTTPAGASSLSPEIQTLRTHWKWAAFSQFFYIFSPLLAMDDVSLNDIEDDLASGNNIHLPRIMQRLLYTLSYDRKVSADNWQTALRKQYYKRDPEANPIGPDPDYLDFKTSRRATSLATSEAEPHGRDSERPVKLETPAPNGVIDEKDAVRTSEAPEAPDDIADAENGVVEEPKDWLNLTMLEKLDSIHLLMEWQFQNVTRLRTLMKSDDEYATWRIEPVGYDAKSNSYWLIGERLWIQRSPLKPPRGSKALKRKRPPPKSSSKKSIHSTKRARLEKAPAQAKGKGKAPPVEELKSRRHGRAAKAQAKLKLDAQAKELDELNRQAMELAREDAGLRSSTRRQGGSSPSKNTTPHPLRTRASGRLRGAENNDDSDAEWQAVPDDWLGKQRKRGAPSEASSVSELTELSESESEEDEKEDEKDDEDENEEMNEDEVEEDEPDEPEDGEQQPESIPVDFVEWETICVTLQEWETIAQRWESATHYSEKAFYKNLTKNIVPIITEELREQERKKVKLQVVEVVTHRKRSSRLAVKESLKEEAQQVAKKKTDEVERNSRAKRAEARQQKEEESRARREAEREERKRDQADDSYEEEEENEDVDVDSQTPPPPKVQTNGRSSRSKTKSQLPAHSRSKNGARTPVEGDWEVDCEICQRYGVNIDGEKQLVSCNSCGKWQHIQCHNTADQRRGLTIRNWKTVDFFCKRCLHSSTRLPNGNFALQTSAQQYSASYAPPHNTHSSSSSYPSLAAPDPYAGHISQSHSRSYGYQAPDPRTNGHGVAMYAQSQGQPSQSSRPISFTHYQPQQRGFSQYPGHTQSYGQMASSSTTAQYGHSYSDSNGYANYNRSIPNGRPAVAEYASAYPPPADPHRGYSESWPQRLPDTYAASYRQNS